MFLEGCSVNLQRQYFPAALCWRGCAALALSLKHLKGQVTYSVRPQFSLFHYKLLHDFDSVLWIAILENPQCQIYLIL